MSRAARLDAVLAVVFIAAVASLSVYQQRPPDVVPADAPLDEFSAGRAIEHVNKIAATPHPRASAEGTAVQKYLIAELSALGLKPQELVSLPSENVRSILAILPGSRPERRALMLCAHHDSRPEAPGAGDDAAGVAAILEAVRALKAGPQLPNDVVVLFTDGEERGMDGARTFVENFQLRRHVGLVLNFEGRGSRGPSYMFETSTKNGWLIREFARAAPHPIATSLTGAVYAEMPNSTDLTVFKSMAMSGLNFAFVDGYENYHQPTDTPANLDKRSLQHHGSYALALTRHFGKLDLSLAMSEPDAIYFHTIGPHLVTYPGWVADALMIATVLVYAFVAMMGARAGRLTEQGTMRGAGLALLAVIVATAVGFGAWMAIAQARQATEKGQGSPEIALVLMTLGFIAAVLTYLIPRGKISTGDLAMGGLFWWLVLTIGVTMRLQGGSYLFLWPTLFGTIGVGATVLARSTDSLIARGLAYVAALPALVLLPTTLQSLCAALGPNLPFVPATMAGLMVVAMVPMMAKVASVIFPTKAKPDEAPATAV